MFGLRGRTFVTGSGDWGVGCKPDFHKCTVFVADFPSSRYAPLAQPPKNPPKPIQLTRRGGVGRASPHIVSTGATFYNDSTGRENGIAFSSGGFSWYARGCIVSGVCVRACGVCSRSRRACRSFARPSYQNTAVEAFLQRTRTPDVLFNRRGRAFPDISAIGSNFQVHS
jgi:hypothetical protein